MNMTPTIVEQTVRLPSGRITLEGSLVIPERAASLVLFVHGSGSGRFSPRNTYVAGVLQGVAIATLLFDLLTAEEDADYQKRFDIDLLMERLIDVTTWAQMDERTQDLRLGYFGASTGAAAALKAATEFDDAIGAIVSRGGRPDLAGDALRKVRAPTLLIVGGNDTEVIALNRHAYDRMRSVKEKELAIIEGATHLFEETGALVKVASLARGWFAKYLP